MTFSYKIAYRNRAQKHRSLRVNSPIRFDFSAGANAIWYNVNTVTSHKSQDHRWYAGTGAI